MKFFLFLAAFILLKEISPETAVISLHDRMAGPLHQVHYEMYIMDGKQHAGQDLPAFYQVPYI